VLPADNPFQVHQTGHISGGEHFGPIGEMVSDAVFAHFDGYAGFCDCESASEATALILAVKADQLNTPDRLE
jgi:hypothetical protein